MKRQITLILFALLFIPFLAFGDGMPIDKNGRFYGGSTTVITLTKEQIKTLSLPENKWHRMALTDEQRSKLKKEAGKSHQSSCFMIPASENPTVHVKLQIAPSFQRDRGRDSPCIFEV